MNIFFLDHDTELCAQSHYDIHVSKMILETAQLLSTAHHLSDSPVREIVYKMTHKNHPSSVWVRESKSHYEWLFELFCELNREFRYRRGKDHLSWVKLKEHLSVPPELPQNGWMPDQYRNQDSLEAYRTYYAQGKHHLHAYTKRQQPSWMNEQNLSPLNNERMVYV